MSQVKISTFFPKENPHFWKCIDSIHIDIKDVARNTLKNMKIEYDVFPEFKQQGTMFYHIPEGRPQRYIAAFDMDWTIAYSEKKLFPSEPDDLELIPGRRKYLHYLFKSGYTIAIFTNQSAKSVKEKQKRVGRVSRCIQLIGLPIYTFIATGDDEYRKPNIGMWQKFIEEVPVIDYAFYCGDAAGRTQDFSNSDRQFSVNIGIDFYTQDEVFPKFAPPHQSGGKELVMFVGAPGTGKSTFYRANYSNYVHINQDTLKTRVNVIRAIKAAQRECKSMVIDATNPSEEKRKELYKLVKNFGYTIKVVYFIKDGRGWNEYRASNGGDKVPTIAYHIYFKNLVSPSISQKLDTPIWKIEPVYYVV